MLTGIVSRAFQRPESLIVTPLSGKIFFRNLRWTTQNSTINVFRGYLVVRHWVSKCRINEEEDLDIGATPCRFGIYLEGFELFLYNRTGLYGAISDLLAKEEEREKGSAGAQTSTNVQGKPVNVTTRPFCITEGTSCSIHQSTRLDAQPT